MLSFIHIPKTGGSTLRWVLDRQYRSFVYVIPQWFDEPDATPLREAAQAHSPAAVGCHRPYSAEAWPGGPALAMVRDPVRRVLSHVAHLRSEPSAWTPEPVPELGLPLADWVERRPLALFDNDQVRYLSGAAEFDGMPMTTAMAEADLERAIAAARTRVAAAPMESFDEALVEWAHRFGWRTPCYRRENVRRRRRDEISARDLAALESWNRLDRRLCEAVEALFRERLSKMERETGRTTAEAVAQFRACNESPAARTAILTHTLRRGLRHPVRAGRMIQRAVRLRWVDRKR